MKKQFLLLVAFLSIITINLFASVGYVVSIKPGASVERKGKTKPLKIKDNVENNDILITDSEGRLRIMFSDEGSVNLGSNTRIALKDIMPSGKKPKFSANILKGAGRFITGEIVKKNPDGYNIKTPQATIGIRGTIFAVEVSPKEQTKLSVLNSHGDVEFNKKVIKSGEQITSKPGDAPVKITPEEADRINNVTSVPEPELDTELIPESTLNPAMMGDSLFDATKNEIVDTINNKNPYFPQY